MGLTNLGFQSTAKGFVCQNGVEEDREFRRNHRVPFGRNGRVEISQGLIIGELCDLSQGGAEEIEYAGGMLLECFQPVTPSFCVFCFGALNQNFLCAACRIYGWEP